MMRGDGPDWLDADGGGYTFLVLAAFEARKASRRYWASGSWADRRYPIHDTFRGPGELGPDDPGLAALRRRRRRQKP